MTWGTQGRPIKGRKQLKLDAQIYNPIQRIKGSNCKYKLRKAYIASLAERIRRFNTIYENS